VNDDSRIYCFDGFRIYAGRREMLRDGAVVGLGMRGFDVLLALIERRGRLVPKDELMQAVWPGAIVEENTLAAQIAAVRRALGDGQDGKRYLLTVQGRGYRFVGLVTEDHVSGAAPEAPPAAAARPADPPAGLPRSNLPLQMTALVGREAELRAVRDLLAQSRCVTVTGAGGVGKTRLVLEIGGALAEQYPDGV
jgi:DNA-binding winged helix-turn-helix (wHTH) protein